jgi:hypothetical protein
MPSGKCLILRSLAKRGLEGRKIFVQPPGGNSFTDSQDEALFSMPSIAYLMLRAPKARLEAGTAVMHRSISLGMAQAACRCAAAARYSLIRLSISGRKCRISPWTGHIAPSAKAQIVCPSIS